jgi:hypothetical protein
LRAAPSRAFGKRERLFEVRGRFGGTSGLNQPDSYDIGGNTFHLQGALAKPHNIMDHAHSTSKNPADDVGTEMIFDREERHVRMVEKDCPMSSPGDRLKNDDFLRFFACTMRAKDFNSGQVA